MKYIEKYTMGMNVEFTLGEPKEFSVRDWTSCTFHPETLIAAMKDEGVVLFESITVNNVEMLCEYDGTDRPETHDASYWYNKGEGRRVQAPLCDHGVAMHGKYTGKVPIGFERGRKYLFSIAFSGPVKSAEVLQSNPIRES